jgi:hypothetical protein
MSLRDIPAHDWRTFLHQFSREHRAWLTTVERVRPGAARHVDDVERPLGSVIPEVTAQGVVGIEIRFQTDSHGDALRVAAPARLRVDETPRGVRALEIEDASGERTRIQFRATARPEALDGLAPGEL